jgi:hypothetical protein
MKEGSFIMGSLKMSLNGPIIVLCHSNVNHVYLLTLLKYQQIYPITLMALVQIKLFCNFVKFLKKIS